MSSPTVYVAVAAIYALRAAAGSQGMPSTRADFAAIMESRYGWKIDDLTIEKIIRQLDAWQLITIMNDRYAGEMLRLYEAKSDGALQHLVELGHRDLIANANVGGREWFLRVFKNQKFWDELYHDPMPEIDAESEQSHELEAVPASDRVVTRADNRREIELIESDVRGLVDEVLSSNEAGEVLGDTRDVIAGELRAAETLLSQAAFRVSRLATLVLPALRYLVEKFAAGAIGEMAKRLITAILGLS